MLKDHNNIARSVLIQEALMGIKGLGYECKELAQKIGLENLMIYKYSKGDIKEAIKTAIKEENMRAMQESSKETVRDRLSTYLKKMSLVNVRVWIRFRAKAIAGVEGNFRHSHVNNMQGRLCSEVSDETANYLDYTLE